MKACYQTEPTQRQESDAVTQLSRKSGSQYRNNALLIGVEISP